MKNISEIRSKLLGWYFSVSWARACMEHSVKRYQEWGVPNKYEEQQLERLLDLEQFLKMTWDEAMEMTQTFKEVK
jgi:hypothetical protein